MEEHREQMEKYWANIENKDDLERGMFLIFPLRYENSAGFHAISVAGEGIRFASNDFVELMNRKCREDGDFVRRYRLDARLSPIHMDSDIAIPDLQLFLFYNGIAFLTVYLSYRNKDVQSVYDFVFPGYLHESDRVKEEQHRFLREIEEKVLSWCEPHLHWFLSEDTDDRIALKDAYRLNAAYVPDRFPDTEILRKITYNEHRIIDLSREFEDPSENDLDYASGAKDVDSEDYGWGCCVTSQEISFVYAQGKGTLEGRAEEDLLLTLLAVYQKYSCLALDEEIHARHMLGKGKARFRKSIQELKMEAMMFVTYGTFEPSQISRWNNVCEIYGYLLKMNGVEESISAIKGKIGLLGEEQDRLDSHREGTIGTIIAVFGLVSIVGAVLQTVDYVSTGRMEMLVGFAASLAGVFLFIMLLLRSYWKRKRSNGDV